MDGAITIRVLLQTARLPFLILTPICLLLGWAFVFSQSDNSYSVNGIILTLVAAIMAHVSVNVLNEYLDFKSGLDMKTRRTPFSGGSGALPRYPEMAKKVLWFGMFALLLTALIGLYFVFFHGWHILPLGLLGIILILFYTPAINRSPWICLIAPGLGFGLLMVPGAYFILTGQYHHNIWLLALIPFFLVNNLLLLNQYPDIEADKSIGRRHFPIVYGIDVSNRVYLLFLLSAIVLLLLMIWEKMLPMLSLFALLGFIPGFYAWSGAVRYRQNIGYHPQYLAANVIQTLTVPAVLALTIIWGNG